jgi:NADH dehydrogenase FAD-containing subunit
MFDEIAQPTGVEMHHETNATASSMYYDRYLTLAIFGGGKSGLSLIGKI